MYVTAVIDEEKCVGCKLCSQVCPEPNAIKFDVSKKKSCIISIRCKGCQICEVSCPKKAISMKQVLQKAV
ncbi:MAG: 4Fe-4S binding protein [Elusimicrobia bacterium]|nr:4Fe-4S binding protein [Elusimicrobiota bacterium]